VISTDSIRHILRNYINEADNPILFASTYETGKFIHDDSLSENKKTIKGFK
jgi:2-phosphoglycerate kinase